MNAALLLLLWRMGPEVQAIPAAPRRRLAALDDTRVRRVDVSGPEPIRRVAETEDRRKRVEE